MIYIFSEKNDISATKVIGWLEYFGSKHLLVVSSEMNKFNCSIEFHNNKLRISFIINGIEHSLIPNDIVWFRRGGKAVIELIETDIQEKYFSKYPALKENYFQERNDFAAFFYKLFGVYAINNPTRYKINKLEALYAATKVGLKIPNTWCGTNKTESLNFLRKNIKVISKSMNQKLLIIIFFLSFASTPIFGQSRLSQTLVDSLTKSRLSSELLQMGKLDQQHRFQLMFGELDIEKVDSLLKLPDSIQMEIFKRMGTSNYGLKRKEYDSLWQIQNSNDYANQKRILEIFGQYGWPGDKLIAQEAVWVPNTILLHLPDSIMLIMYSKLKREIKKANIKPSTVATMYDKYLQGIGKPQLYGMFANSDTDGKRYPLIKNIKITNKARKKLGMMPLENYKIVQ